MFRISGEVWVNIQSVNDKTQVVHQEITMPLTTFDQIILNRDSMLKDAVEVVPIDEQGQPTMAG
jgi:hypothetical protein